MSRQEELVTKAFFTAARLTPEQKGMAKLYFSIITALANEDDAEVIAERILQERQTEGEKAEGDDAEQDGTEEQADECPTTAAQGKEQALCAEAAELAAYLEAHPEISISRAAEELLVSRQTLLDTIRGRRTPRAETRTVIRTWLEEKTK